jgi:peptidoglycan/xylan/chitin deacetylase (PgdA/CDA1 family)
VRAVAPGVTGETPRRRLKRLLAVGHDPAPTTGTTVLIYHRVGGGTVDERDVTLADFTAQLESLRARRVVSLDQALDELAAGDDRPKVVLTFDDGFADVHSPAWPLLRDAGLPFTLYVTTAYIGGTMHWPGSTASEPGPGLSWDQLGELSASPLVTIGNHTHTHARPELLTADELDRCTAELEDRLGVTPRHFCFTWGVDVPAARPLLAERFRSATTGRIGRIHPGADLLSLPRIPVRGSDPIEFFQAKVTGSLRPELTYERIVRTAKRLGAGRSS